MAYLYGQAALHAQTSTLLISAGLAMQLFLFPMWALVLPFFGQGGVFSLGRGVFRGD